MRVPLTDRQRERLRAVRAAQLAEWGAGRPQAVDTLFVEEPVVRLMSGLGRAAYLGPDSTQTPYHWAAAYSLAALVILVLGFLPGKSAEHEETSKRW